MCVYLYTYTYSHVCVCVYKCAYIYRHIHTVDSRASQSVESLACIGINVVMHHCSVVSLAYYNKEDSAFTHLIAICNHFVLTLNWCSSINIMLVVRWSHIFNLEILFTEHWLTSLFFHICRMDLPPALCFGVRPYVEWEYQDVLASEFDIVYVKSSSVI